MKSPGRVLQEWHAWGDLSGFELGFESHTRGCSYSSVIRFTVTSTAQAKEVAFPAPRAHISCRVLDAMPTNYVTFTGAADLRMRLVCATLAGRALRCVSAFIAVPYPPHAARPRHRIRRRLAAAAAVT